MANFKRKANYKSKRSCGLCKPWKRWGNRKSSIPFKYQAMEIVETGHSHNK
jgi:hypothetical protein